MFRKIYNGLIVVIALLALTSCEFLTRVTKTADEPAVVWDELPGVGRTYRYKVKSGDTLYAISRLHGLTVDAIAEMNGIEPPYIISPGQELIVRPTSPAEADVVVEPDQSDSEPQEAPEKPPVSAPSKVAVAKPTPTPAPTPTPSTKTEATEPTVFVARTEAKPSIRLPSATQLNTSDFPGGWSWPVAVQPSNTFGKDDGLNYLVPEGTEIKAAASGRVSYAGQALSDFRYMILVKTNDDYVVQYDFNTELIVSENDLVKRGDTLIRITDKVAKENDDLKLHRRLYFAVWLKGKPQNPHTLIRSG